jgi:glutathione S-transferase
VNDDGGHQLRRLRPNIIPSIDLLAAQKVRASRVAPFDATELDRIMLRLHDSASSGNAYKVRLLLKQLGLGFERVEYDVDRGATRTPEFLGTKNSNGRVPVLELADGRCLAESNAILWYLAEGTQLVPDAANDPDRWLRAEILQWMFFEQYSHEPNIATLRHWITHRLEMTPERQAAAPGKRKQGVAALEVMERHLRERRFFVGERYTIADIALYAYERRFFVGERYTIADIALYAYTHVADEGGFDLTPLGAVRAWLERVAAQPGHVAITA